MNPNDEESKMGILESAVSIAGEFLVEMKESNVQRKRQNDINERVFNLQDKQFELKNGKSAAQVGTEIHQAIEDSIVKEAMASAEVVVAPVVAHPETPNVVESQIPPIIDDKAVVKQMRKDITAAGRGDEIKGCQAAKVILVHASLGVVPNSIGDLNPEPVHPSLFPDNPTGAIQPAIEVPAVVVPEVVAPAPTAPVPAPAPVVAPPVQSAPPAPAPVEIPQAVVPPAGVSVAPSEAVHTEQDMYAILTKYQGVHGDSALGALIVANGGATFSQVPKANWNNLAFQAAV